MGSDEPAGVVFPASAGGRRSTSALGQAVVADALGQADPDGAQAAGQEKDWRKGYPAHFRRLTEAALPSGDAAVSVARGGLDSLHRRMRVIGADGAETGLGALGSEPARQVLATVTVTGGGKAERELSLPYRGERLQGSALARKLEAWAAGGVIEPACAQDVQMVAAHPQWLALPGRTVVVLGAGAEIGPLAPLLGWGARVAGVDLPRAPLWPRVLDLARRSAGTLLVPVSAGQQGQHPAEAAGDGLARHAGVDLAVDVPAAADWLAGIEGPLVLGNYAYADGAAHVRIATAVDALTVRLLADRRDLALAFLATPTDVFVVPADAVGQSARAFADRPQSSKIGRASCRERV